MDPGPLRCDNPRSQHYQRRCLILVALQRAEGQPPPSEIGRCFLIMVIRVNHSPRPASRVIHGGGTHLNRPQELKGLWKPWPICRLSEIAGTVAQQIPGGSGRSPVCRHVIRIDMYILHACGANFQVASTIYTRFIVTSTLHAIQRATPRHDNHV